MTFDMTGGKKQDMHVSYRTTRVIVSWKVERTVDKVEEDIAVREREIRRFSHTIPLPDGTKASRRAGLLLASRLIVSGEQFDEVRASRDGQRLTLTLPNSRCVRVTGGEDQRPDSPGTIPDIDVRISSRLLLSAPKLSTQ